MLSNPTSIARITAKSIHLHSGEHIAFTSGEALAVNTGSSMAAAQETIQFFASDTGVRLVALKQDIGLKALKSNLTLLAKLKLTMHAQTIQIQAQKQLLINGGGSYVRFDASGIEGGTTGQVQFHAATKNWVGAKTVEPPEFPSTMQGDYGAYIHMQRTAAAAYAGYRWKVEVSDGQTHQGITDEQGLTRLVKTDASQKVKTWMAELKANQEITEPYAANLEALREQVKAFLSKHPITQLLAEMDAESQADFLDNPNTDGEA